jgi:dTDP-4-dehydrorhamnose reductase
VRALVIGASGQVGAALCARLAACGHAAVGTHARVPLAGTRRLDFTDLAATERLIAETAPDWVFCPAGLTAVDYCEEHAEEAFRANRDAPATAARAAARLGAPFVFYSTEYVFDGTGGPYGEHDPVHPLSVYGRSKLEGERAALTANPRALAVRTTVVYGPEPQGKNFVYQLLRHGRARQPMRVPTDQRSSPTYNADLAAVSIELVERAISGIVHVAGPQVLDRHAFALQACAAFELDPAFVTPVTTAELRQRAARPLAAGLRSERARLLATSELRGPAAGLAAMREALAASTT